MKKYTDMREQSEEQVLSEEIKDLLDDAKETANVWRRGLARGMREEKTKQESGRGTRNLPYLWLPILFVVSYRCSLIVVGNCAARIAFWLETRSAFILARFYRHGKR